MCHGSNTQYVDLTVSIYFSFLCAAAVTEVWDVCVSVFMSPYRFSPPDLLKLSLLLGKLSVHPSNDFFKLSSFLCHGSLLLAQTLLQH